MSALDCARASTWMSAAEAGRLAEDEACRLEDHLQVCVDCRAARGRLAALAALLREPPSTESRPGAMERIVARALAGERPPRARPVPSTWRRAAGIAAAFVGAAALSWWWFTRPEAPPARTATLASGAVEAGGARMARGSPLPRYTELRARTAATLRLHGATLRLEPGTQVSLRGRDDVRLGAGRVEVTVEPGAPFAVHAARFVARAHGTRFVVTSASVEVTEGRVVVSSVEGTTFATLGPGGRWSLPAPPPIARASAPPDALAPAPPSIAAPAQPEAVTPAPSTGHRRVTPVESPAVEPAPTLADVRAALRARETVRARALLDRLQGSAGVSRAEVDLLHADSLRLERRFAEAVREYHAIARRHAGTGTGEVALFTAAQLELDRLGRSGDARRTLDEYRRRHPNGRFRAEVERLRASLSPPTESQ